MKKKFNKKRLQILKDYQSDVFDFVVVNLIAMVLFMCFFLVIKDHPFNMGFWPFLSIILVWLVVFSFVYEVIIRFGLGLEIRFKIKELLWSFQKENKMEGKE